MDRRAMGAAAGGAVEKLSPAAVMPGLVPGIHVLTTFQRKDVDGRDEPGHDVESWLQGQTRRAILQSQ
jgi:hypothetical protein